MDIKKPTMLNLPLDTTELLRKHAEHTGLSMSAIAAVCIRQVLKGKEPAVAPPRRYTRKEMACIKALENSETVGPVSSLEISKMAGVRHTEAQMALRGLALIGAVVFCGEDYAPPDSRGNQAFITTWAAVPRLRAYSLDGRPFRPDDEDLYDEHRKPRSAFEVMNRARKKVSGRLGLVVDS